MSAKYVVLCLGLLIGFVIGFVLLLSYIPVRDGVDAYATKVDTRDKQQFDFYKYLPGNARHEPPTDVRVQPHPVAKTKVPKEEIIVNKPITATVPANAQIVHQSPQYTEVPANYHRESYYLQAGRFGHPQDAHALRAQVLLLGLDAFIVTRVEADGATAHRVRVGPYFDQNMLTEAKKRLQNGGIAYEIVRVTG